MRGEAKRILKARPCEANARGEAWRDLERSEVRPVFEAMIGGRGLKTRRGESMAREDASRRLEGCLEAWLGVV
jgi:hypothetical protein